MLWRRGFAAKNNIQIRPTAARKGKKKQARVKSVIDLLKDFTSSLVPPSPVVTFELAWLIIC